MVTGATGAVGTAGVVGWKTRGRLLRKSHLISVGNLKCFTIVFCVKKLYSIQSIYLQDWLGTNCEAGIFILRIFETNLLIH